MKSNDNVVTESKNEQKSSTNPNKNSYFLTRIVLIRFLAFIYGKL